MTQHCRPLKLVPLDCWGCHAALAMACRHMLLVLVDYDENHIARCSRSLLPSRAKDDN